MAGKRTHLSKIAEIKRLIGLGLKDRAIARALKVSRNTVAGARGAGESEDSQLVAKSSADEPLWCEKLDWERVRSEHEAGTDLTVLWEELVENGTVPVQYPGFWKQFSARFPKVRLTMVRVFQPGERTEIDYCDGISFIDLVTGEVIDTQLFVGVLCHSRYAFAEFTLSQKSHDFLSSHVHMFEFFGGVTHVVAPDNLKSAVSKVHRYDPVINPAYTKLAAHYDVGVVPARVRTPKDKAIVERTVQIFQRWFYAKVRHRTFSSLVELNVCLRDNLSAFNAKRHRILRRTRWEMFQDERKHLRSLPQTAYEVATHLIARLHPDCHLLFDKNLYSAPWRLRGLQLDIWATATSVEISHQGERVAFHVRIYGRGGIYQTNKLHYPPAAQAYAETTIQAVLQQAHAVGPETGALATSLLNTASPFRHLRRTQGIVRLGKSYGKDNLEAACKRANELEQKTYPFIERLLKRAPRLSEENTTIRRNQNIYLRGESLFH
jgi:transposase